MTTLRLLLVLVVLLDVAFVQITQAARTAWLLPLYGLTLAAPLLHRCTQRLLYRMFWNGAVLGIFAMLVLDGLRMGASRLLEYGLLLAAFCQVHLVNNLRDDQKPDLLFFNSLLIALVTGFFCQDVEFSIVFVAWAFAMLVAMQAAAIRTAEPTPIAVPLRASAALCCVVLLGTLAAFVCVPRDFQRRGLVDERLLQASGLVRGSGQSDSVVLGSSARTVQSQRVVMRARVARGRPEDVPAHWRGMTFVRYDDRGWQASNVAQRRTQTPLDREWTVRRPGFWSRATRADGPEVEVEVFDAEGRICVPLTAVRVALNGIADPTTTSPRLDGTFHYAGRDRAAGGQPAFRVVTHLSTPPSRSDAPTPERVGAGLLTHVYVPPHLVPPILVTLVREWTRDLAPDAPQRVVVERLRARLATHTGYLLPGEQGAARDLPHFLAGAGGHCEYFATALALMLRQRGIPCRLATGYLVHEWKEDVATIRSRDAHAWVEVRDPDGHWYAADATPPRSADDGDEGGLFADVGAWFARVWERIAAFDGDARDEWIAWIVGRPAAAWSAVVDAPLRSAAAVASATFGFVLLWRRRRRRTATVVHDYERAVAATGLRRRDDETPREFLVRVAASDLRDDVRDRLAAATVAHEAGRYRVPATQVRRMPAPTV